MQSDFTFSQKLKMTVIEENIAHKEEVNSEGSTPLHSACIYGHLNIVKYLIEEQHANTSIKDCRMQTPIQVANRKGHKDIIEYLKKYEVPPPCRI